MSLPMIPSLPCLSEEEKKMKYVVNFVDKTEAEKVLEADDFRYPVPDLIELWYRDVVVGIFPITEIKSIVVHLE